MPQPFRDAVITNKGLQLLTKAQAGEVKIEFTRVVTGSGSYTENERNTSILQERELLKDQKNSYGLSNIEIYSECSVKLTALITNHDPVTEQVLVTEGYYINEMGIYAKPYGASQDTEVLYSITVTSGETGDYMPTYNGYNPTQIIQDYFVTVNNAPEVTLQTDNGAVALADDLVAFEQRTVNALNNKVDKDGDVSNTIVTFSQSDTRGNIKSGEKLSVIFGKIMKMFSDMKQAAFYSVINNLLTTQTGVGVLDAYQGKVLKDLYDALNRNVTELNKKLMPPVFGAVPVNAANCSTNNGKVEYTKWGNLVILQVYDLHLKVVPLDDKTVIASGLPRPCACIPGTIWVARVTGDYPLRVGMHKGGNELKAWWNWCIYDYKDEVKTLYYSGQLMYFTND